MEYNRRKWLNPKRSSSTGSIVCFSGLANWSDEGKRPVSRFIEISDCHNKIRIHQSQFETQGQFLSKVEILKEELELYIEFLKKELK